MPTIDPSPAPVTVDDPVADAVSGLQQQIDAPAKANATLYAQRDSLLKQLHDVQTQISTIEGPDIQKKRRMLQRIQQIVANNG